MQDGTAQLRIRRLSNFAANGLPVGFEYFTINKNIRTGSLPLLGGLYSRELYADLWSWVQEQPGYLISETEWQQKSQANNGNVPFYSSGDGSTTFRVPSLKCWVKGANGIEEVGSYLEAGLPNITGKVGNGSSGVSNNLQPATGAFLPTQKYQNGGYSGTANVLNILPEFDASKSNPIYGKSEEVTPESIVGLYCVIAFSTISNTGNLDIQTFINQFNQMKEQWQKTMSQVDYSREKLFTPNKTSITVPANLNVKIGDGYYSTAQDITLQLSGVGTAENLAGKDIYIYACQPVDISATNPILSLSLNSTVPDGYNADNSRKIGGFHCLCANVGTISGHTLSGYVAGDILPQSVWDLIHRPKCSPEGMVYIPEVDIWMDIYLNSWNGSKLVSVNGGTTADGASTKKFHGEQFVERLADIKKRLPWRYEFQVAAKGSNEGTNIKGSTDANTTGGHVDTAGRRMISNYGLEDACGFLWQWASDVGVNGSSGWNDSVYNSGVDDQSYGRSYGTLYRALLGGYWYDGSGCGSRSVSVANASAYVYSHCGGRGCGEPLHKLGN